jgi:hypothetical protein
MTARLPTGSSFESRVVPVIIRHGERGVSRYAGKRPRAAHLRTVRGATPFAAANPATVSTDMTETLPPTCENAMTVLRRNDR